MRTLFISISIAAVSLLIGCMDAPSCTHELRSVAVVVTDLANTPVDGLTPVTTYDRTGTTISVTQFDNPGEHGNYTVIDDSQASVIGDHTEGVTFTVSSAQGTATGHYDIEGGPCHIVKADGPDMLVLQ